MDDDFGTNIVDCLLNAFAKDIPWALRWLVNLVRSGVQVETLENNIKEKIISNNGNLKTIELIELLKGGVEGRGQGAIETYKEKMINGIINNPGLYDIYDIPIIENYEITNLKDKTKGCFNKIKDEAMVARQGDRPAGRGLAGLRARYGVQPAGRGGSAPGKGGGRDWGRDKGAEKKTESTFGDDLETTKTVLGQRDRLTRAYGGFRRSNPRQNKTKRKKNKTKRKKNKTKLNKRNTKRKII